VPTLYSAQPQTTGAATDSPPSTSTRRRKPPVQAIPIRNSHERDRASAARGRPTNTRPAHHLLSSVEGAGLFVMHPTLRRSAPKPRAVDPPWNREKCGGRFFPLARRPHIPSNKLFLTPKARRQIPPRGPITTPAARAGDSTTPIALCGWGRRSKAWLTVTQPRTREREIPSSR